MPETTMQIALSKAGVPVKPKKERAWQIVKDMGSATAAQIQRIAPDVLPAYVSQMASCGVFVAKYDTRMSNGRRTRVATYSCAHETWEDANDALSSKYRKYTGSRKAAKNAAKEAPIIEPTAAPRRAVLADALPAELEGLTIAQLRECHRVLCSLFGGEA